ncbi:carbonic anhydrase [Xenococcus sp. PCC 7305]|uniref:carbonic anhydrase n=1 Tax=Xenococcus sp. PCC 7305 TaxID=102125 RepID=UPI0002AC4878|nr:carbonic anhydrase family protein [Xenococcus sp. PCC 7305]ELS05517.1 carbonic anhydrase [Xenococcus sp. PCC 7305]
MKRRDFLTKTTQIIGTGVTGAMPFYSFAKALALSHNEAKWGYIGNLGPKYWGTISSEYRICQTGLQQSPINFKQGISADFANFKITSAQVPLKILNNGHSIQINTDPGNLLQLDSIYFQLKQFHFHHPSEHKVRGKSYPMELHLLYENTAGDVAVVGVFLTEGLENKALQPIWDAMPLNKQPETLILGTTVDISRFLPQNQSVYRYRGSLTTPPCSELVQWVIFQEPIEISKAQIEKFKQIFPHNARPIQHLNRRFSSYKIQK